MSEKKVRWGELGLYMSDKFHMPNIGFGKIFIEQKEKSEETKK